MRPPTGGHIRICQAWDAFCCTGNGPLHRNAARASVPRRGSWRATRISHGGAQILEHTPLHYLGRAACAACDACRTSQAAGPESAERDRDVSEPSGRWSPARRTNRPSADDGYMPPLSILAGTPVGIGRTSSLDAAKIAWSTGSARGRLSRGSCARVGRAPRQPSGSWKDRDAWPPRNCAKSNAGAWSMRSLPVATSALAMYCA